jgi:hypothetical protein
LRSNYPERGEIGGVPGRMSGKEKTMQGDLFEENQRYIGDF